MNVLLQVTEVSFDFDDFDEEEFTAEERQEVVDAVVGNVFEVEVDDNDTEEDVANALLEHVIDHTGWVVVSLDFRQVVTP